MIKVFDGQSADGDSTVLKSPGGVLKAHVNYAAGTGTVTVQTSPDQGTTYDSVGSDGELTASGQVAFITAEGEYVKFVLSGSSGADIDAWVGFGEALPGYGLEVVE